MHEYITIRADQEPPVTLDGAILVGGLSRRMGRDKALLTLDGTRAIDAISDALRPLVHRIRLIGREAESGKAFTGFEIQPDLRPGLGPLGGIHAALATSQASSMLVVACDLPFVTTGFLRGLVEALSPDLDAVVPCPAGVPVAVCAVYRRSCLSSLEACLDRGELAARDFPKSLRARFLSDEEIARLDPSGRCLWNLNTPEDYQQALQASRERK